MTPEGTVLILGLCAIAYFILLDLSRRWGRIHEQTEEIVDSLLDDGDERRD